MHAGAHAEIFETIEISLFCFVGEPPSGCALLLADVIPKQLEGEAQIGPHAAGWPEAGAAQSSLRSMSDEMLLVRPPGHLASEASRERAIAQKAVYLCSAQGQRHGERAVEGVCRHMGADAARDQHLWTVRRASRFAPFACRPRECLPARQAPISVPQFKMKEPEAPEERPSLHQLAPFPQCKILHRLRC